MTRNLTKGNPAKLIVLFTIPLLIGNLFQQFYSMADTLIVGRTVGVNALAGGSRLHGEPFVFDFRICPGIDIRLIDHYSPTVWSGR